MPKTRRERDSLGSLKIPADAPRGIYTERVLENYPQHPDDTVPESFLRTYVRVKIVYARVNAKSKKIPRETRKAIVDAGRRLLRLTSSSFMEHFPIGKIQSGGGTSTNMMVNEVLANLANKELGKKFGDKAVNSHDHVNASQSSNDTFPGTTKLTCIKLLHDLQRELVLLKSAFQKRADRFGDIEKVGRTHLQDAIVVTLGNEFAAYARTVEKNAAYLSKTIDILKEVNFGGTATGSLQNITPKMRKELIKRMGKKFRMKLKQPKCYFEQNSSSTDFAYTADMLARVSNDLIKIGNDLRLLTSGPLAGIAEIKLPAVQPGSSIMPGKVNPSIPEAMNMIAAQVIGNRETVHLLTRQAQLELQQFMPQITRSLIESIELLTKGVRMFKKKCVQRIKPSKRNINKNLKNSFAYATSYSEELGYDTVAKLVRKAMRTGASLQDLLDEKLAKQQKNSKKNT